MPAVKKALQGQMQDFYNAGQHNGFPIALNLIDQYVTGDKMAQVLSDLMADCGSRWGYATWREYKSVKRLGEGIISDLKEFILNYFQQYLLNVVADITEYTKEIIRQRLSEGLEAGQSYEETARTLVDDEINTVRARRITRTESVRSANAGAVEGARKTGLLMRKEWVAVQDKRTRHDHRIADGQVVEMDATFNVNGVPMSQPGDPKAPPKEVINCRCVVVFQPVRDNQGRPIRVTP